MNSKIAKSSLTKDNIHNFNLLIEEMINLPIASDFKEPVDYVGLGLIDYLSIVEVPMDLSTVKMKLNNGRYTTIQAVINDLDLIWSNCKHYNRENSRIHTLALKCEKHCKKLISRYFKKKTTEASGASTKNKNIMDYISILNSNKSQNKTTALKSDEHNPRGIYENKKLGSDNKSNRKEDKISIKLYDDEELISGNDQVPKNFKINSIIEDKAFVKFNLKQFLITFEERLIFKEKIQTLNGNSVALLLREIQKLNPQILEEIDDNFIQVKPEKLDYKSYEILIRYYLILLNIRFIDGLNILDS